MPVYVTEHIPVVRFIINKRNSFITTVADYSILKKDVQGCNLREKRQKKIVFLLRYYNDKIMINTKTHLYMTKKLFDLIYIKNDFAKYGNSWK